MRRQFLSYLIDPVSGEKFQLTIFKQNRNHILSGLIKSPDSWYPIIQGVPRILTGKLKLDILQKNGDFFQRYQKKMPAKIQKDWQAAMDKIDNLDKFLLHQKKTGESFAWEWKNIYRENKYEKENFLHFLSPFIKAPDLKGKIVIDIGCGSGRFTKWGAKLGAKLVFGTDLGESVEKAYQMTKNLVNVCIIQADIYNMPFLNTFDIGYSIGVLHHLPTPQTGFICLPTILKKNGQMLIWVYNRRNNRRALYFYEPLRTITKHIPKPLLFQLCYLPAIIIHSINWLTYGLKKIGQPELAKKIPFSYYANFPFNMKLNDAFDVLATPKSNYYYTEDVKSWFRAAKLKKIKAYEHPEAGITCIGTK